MLEYFKLQGPLMRRFTPTVWVRPGLSTAAEE